MEGIIPYDCWKLILEYLRQDVANDCKYFHFYYYSPLNPLDVYLMILRSTSHSIQNYIKKYQRERALIFGFEKGTVTYYLSHRGYLSCLKYFVMDLKYTVGQYAADAAAEEGHYECLKFIGDANPSIGWKYDSAHKAAKGGNYSCLVYCHQRGASISLPELQAAASTGNLEMVKYIRPHINPDHKGYYSRNAAENGHLHILQYSVENGDGLHDDVCLKAAEKNHYECLVYAHQNGGKINEECVHAAVMFGAVKCAMYLLERTKITAGSDPFFKDSPTGRSHINIDLLKLLHRQGATWGYYTAATAIESGSAECLRFVLETGAPKEGGWSLSRRAIQKNDWIDYFKVLEEYDVPYHPTDYFDRSNEGKFECMIYLRETARLPWPEYFSEHLVRGEYFHFLEYAHEHGCPWGPKACHDAVARSDGDVRFLKYAHEHGAPWDERTTFMAASKGHLELLKYAHENGCPWNQKTIREADFRGHKKCVEYMQREGLKLVNTYSWDE